jgi:hypothetical protein
MRAKNPLSGLRAYDRLTDQNHPSILLILHSLYLPPFLPPLPTFPTSIESTLELGPIVLVSAPTVLGIVWWYLVWMGTYSCRVIGPEVFFFLHHFVLVPRWVRYISTKSHIHKKCGTLRIFFLPTMRYAEIHQQWPFLRIRKTSPRLLYWKSKQSAYALVLSIHIGF